MVMPKFKVITGKKTEVDGKAAAELYRAATTPTLTERANQQTALFELMVGATQEQLGVPMTPSEICAHWDRVAQHKYDPAAEQLPDSERP